jgi:23S rRNA-/tRNA-specific pseudouridylate synthase
MALRGVFTSLLGLRFHQVPTIRRLAQTATRPFADAPLSTDTTTTTSPASTPVVDVVFEDEHYFFVHKPAGLVVAGQRPEENIVSFHDLVKQHSIKHYNGHWPTLLHRLDKETSGLMVYAKTKEAAKHFLGLQEKRGAITKEYLAVVK